MNIKRPALRLHQLGQYIVQIAGKVHYLGKNKAQAELAYSVLMADWQPGQRPTALPSAIVPLLPLPPAALVALPAVLPPAPVPLPPKAKRTVAAVWDELLESIENQVAVPTFNGYRNQIKPFTKMYGKRDITEITTKDLFSFRSFVYKKGYKPNSINPLFVLIKRLLNYAYDVEYLDRPFRYKKALESVAQLEAPVKALSIEDTKAFISFVWRYNSNVARMMLLQYWACLRPSEVSRVVYQEGEWDPHEEGVFILAKSKTEGRTGERRRVVLTPAALVLLSTIQQECPNGYAYGQAFQKIRNKAKSKNQKLPVEHFCPHILRHSSQTHLIRAGVIREYVECAAGHTLPKVQRVYSPHGYAKTREAMAVLPTLVPIPKLPEVIPVNSGWYPKGTKGYKESNK